VTDKIDRDQLRKMERALAKDWRELKNLLEQNTITDQHAEETVDNLNCDMILPEGKSIKELVSQTGDKDDDNTN